MDQQAKAELSQLLLERVDQHKENLRLWQNGFLNPTEPDADERQCVMRELKACLFEIRTVALHFGMWNVIDRLPDE